MYSMRQKAGEEPGNEAGTELLLQILLLIGRSGKMGQGPCAHGIIHMYKQTMVQGSIPTSLLSSHLSTVD